MISMFPDKLYKDIDKFDNEITQLVHPLPVEDLIIDATTTFPRIQFILFLFHKTCFLLKTWMYWVRH